MFQQKVGGLVLANYLTATSGTYRRSVDDSLGTFLHRGGGQCWKAPRQPRRNNRRTLTPCFGGLRERKGYWGAAGCAAPISEAHCYFSSVSYWASLSQAITLPPRLLCPALPARAHLWPILPLLSRVLLPKKGLGASTLMVCLQRHPVESADMEAWQSSLGRAVS